MFTKMAIGGVSMALALSLGCGQSPPTPAQAKESHLAKLEKAHATLSAEVAAGKVPKDARRMGREIGVLAASLKGSESGALAEKLEKEISTLEDLLDAQSDLKKVEAALKTVGESIAALKAKKL